VAEIEDWEERFLLAAENALRSRSKDEEALKDERIKKLERKVGELASCAEVSPLRMLKTSGGKASRGRGIEWYNAARSHSAGYPAPVGRPRSIAQ
jgi:hypothetical protein